MRAQHGLRTLVAVWLLFATMSGPRPAFGRPTIGPPPLPPPVGTVVRVSTEPQLQAAVRAIRSNTTIVLAAGTYRLTASLQFKGPLANVGLRGSTDSRDDVVLAGMGMTRPADDAPYGVWVGGDVQDIVIANLTIRDVSRHAIIFNAGTERPHVYNVHLLDIGQQFIKSNPGDSGGGVNDGIVEYSVIEYTTTAPSGYTNGIDVHRGSNWIIRDNLFRNIVAPGTLAGPAVLVWNRSRNTVTERNRFLNCARGVSYGLEIAGADHSGGIIRNNVFFRSRSQPGDVGIMVADSPKTEVLNNTVFVSGTYATPIEYRFPGARDVVIANNLLDGTIRGRDGATARESHNFAGAAEGMFVDGIMGDLHLSASADAAIDRGVQMASVTDDWDGAARPRGAAYDIGAMEFAPGSKPAPARSRLPEIPVQAPSTRVAEVIVVDPPPVRATAAAVPTPSGTLLVQSKNLIRVGAFRVPAGTFGGSTFGYGATGLAFNADGGSLFITGHEWHQQVAEITVPAIRNGSTLGDLATAAVLQPFADITEGRLLTILPSDPNAKKIGGLLADQGQLFATGYAYYDGANAQVVSHFVRGPQLGATGVIRGPFQVGTLGAGFVSGYMASVPPAWRRSIGGPAITGQCCIGVISRSSYGPAAFVIDPSTLGARTPVPAAPLVYYPTKHPLLDPHATGDGWGNTSTLFNGTTEVRGVVFPEGTASVLFFGRHGTGTFCYGPGTADRAKAGTPATDFGDNKDKWCYDPTDGSKGTHAYPYAYYVWAYDASELAAVRAGAKDPWNVRPYATWTLELPFSDPGAAHINGAAYDPSTGRIFITQSFADGDRPVIHVFRIAR